MGMQSPNCDRILEEFVLRLEVLRHNPVVWVLLGESNHLHPTSLDRKEEQ